MFLEVLVQYSISDLGSQSAGAAGFIIGEISFGDFCLDHLITKIKPR